MSIKIIKNNDNFQIKIEDNLKDVIYIRKVIEMWLEKLKINEFKIMTVKLCMEEAIYNGIIHAYKNLKNAKKIVDCTVKKSKDHIKINIQDYGNIEWYKNFKMPEPEKEELSPRIQGRGLLLINRLASNLNINKKTK